MATESESLSAWMRRRRMERGWSQAKLAHELGVVPQSVHRWESGAALRMANYQRVMQVLASPTDQPPPPELLEQEADDRLSQVLEELREVRAALEEIATGLRSAELREGESRERRRRVATPDEAAEAEAAMRSPRESPRRDRRAGRRTANHGPDEPKP